jgi:chromosome segregation ATPase
MFFEIPQNLILMTTGAFLLGWLLSSVTGSLGSRMKAKKRDPRDNRIRSLEAELRIAQTGLESAKGKIEELEESVKEMNEEIEKRDSVISHQQERMANMSTDLKGSVLKTRELRSELSDRATENIKSEVKLREVETELEVAQASTDMIATGVLDYSLAPDVDEGSGDRVDESDKTKAAN